MADEPGENPSDQQLKEWLTRAAEGEECAIEQLWRVYYPKLKSAVNARIVSIPRLAGESSDLTSKSLAGFLCSTIRSPVLDLTDVNSVWKLLKVVALRHIKDVAKQRFAQKRGGPLATISLDQAIGGKDDVDKTSLGMGRIATALWDKSAPDPCDGLLFDELVEKLLANVPDERTKSIVLMRLNDYSNGEIADMLKISIRTVQRHIKEIEELWMTLHSVSQKTESNQ